VFVVVACGCGSPAALPAAPAGRAGQGKSLDCSKFEHSIQSLKPCGFQRFLGEFSTELPHKNKNNLTHIFNVNLTLF
jgi:hypothetical protein